MLLYLDVIILLMPKNLDFHASEVNNFIPVSVDTPVATEVTQASSSISPKKIRIFTTESDLGAVVNDEIVRDLPVSTVDFDLIDVLEKESKMDKPESNARMQAMMESIRLNGPSVVPPILIRRIGDRYQVIDGHHRYGAFKRLNLKEIPVILVPDDRIEIMDENHPLMKVHAAVGTAGRIIAPTNGLTQKLLARSNRDLLIQIFLSKPENLPQMASALTMTGFTEQEIESILDAHSKFYQETQSLREDSTVEYEEIVKEVLNSLGE
jgi:hypothetical protein